MKRKAASYPRKDKRIKRPYPKRRGTKKKSYGRKATKKIKSIVKRQLECDFNKSVFERNYHFEKSPFVAPGKQFWLFDGNPNDAVEPNFGFDGTNFNFRILSPEKLLDAASVLYNNKSKDLGATSITNNFNPEKTSANFHYASATYTITNCTDVEYEFLLFEGKSKTTGPNDLRDNFILGVQNSSWVGGEPFTTDFGVYPTQFSRTKELYSFKRQKFVLKPGQKKKLYYKFSGCVDFRKYASTTAGAVLPVGRGFKELNIACYPTETVTYRIDAVTPENGVTYPNRSATEQSPSRCIAVEVNEVYKVQQPDETKDDYEGNFRCLHNYTMEAPSGSLTIQKYASNPNIIENITPLI